MLVDTLVICAALGIWLGLGYPIARTFGPSVLWPAFAALPFGLAICGILMPLLYVSGLRLVAAFQICCGLAVPGLVLAVREAFFQRWTRAHRAALAAICIAAVFVLLPKWLGPPEFSVFQGTPGDQLSWLNLASMASHFDFAAFRNMDLDTRVAIGSYGLVLPTNMLTHPSIPLMLGGLVSSTFKQPMPIASYAFLCALQMCTFFASAFAARNLFRLSAIYTLLIAFSLTTGFYLQYAYDINAWSHLASLSLITLYVGLLILGLSTQRPGNATIGVRGGLSDWAFFIGVFICAAGFFYIYPEIVPIVGFITAAIILFQFVFQNHFFSIRRVTIVALAFGVAVVLCAFAWPVTLGWLFHSATSFAAANNEENYWKHFDAYLFGYDIDPNTAFQFAVFLHRSLFSLLYHVFSLFTNFLVGVFGLYFLLPNESFSLAVIENAALLLTSACLLVFWSRGSLDIFRAPDQRRDLNLLAGALSGLLVVAGLHSTGLLLASEHGLVGVSVIVRILWKLTLVAALTSLLVLWFDGLLRRSSAPEYRIDRSLFAGVIGGAVAIGVLVCLGRYWAAGKGLIMLSPVLYLTLTGSLLAAKPKRLAAKILVFGYIGLQICFGAYRSYAAAHNDFGIHYLAPPYPLTSYQKTIYRWDPAGLQAELAECSRVSVDIEDPYPELFAATMLNEQGVKWSSTRPLWDFVTARRGSIFQTQVQNPDCVVTTEVSGLQTNGKIIWLRRDDRIYRFYRGETDRLDLVPPVPMELNTEGLAVEESRNVGLAWTNGHASIHVPNNPDHPAKYLVLAVDPERPRGIRMSVVINGHTVSEELLPQSDWSTTIELPDIGSDPWLDIEINSDTFSLANDTRTLGVRLRFLSLDRSSRE